MPIEWKNMDAVSAYAELRKTDTMVNLAEDLNAERVKNLSVSAGGGLDFRYGASLVSPTDINRLQNLADQQQLVDKFELLLSGEPVNTSEKRGVLHHLTRTDDGSDAAAFYREQNTAVRRFSEAVHSGEIHGSTGRNFDTAVQIGIGGSDLGPRALHLALEGAYPARMRALFVSNVDPDDAAEVISRIDPETTLFILVSKSGTTQETLANRSLILNRLTHLMKQRGICDYDPAMHLAAVTSRTSPLAASKEVRESFFIDDFIGGRYSSTSAVGAAVLSLAYGHEVFSELLAGAHEADQAARGRNLPSNAALMDAMIGIFNRNVLGLPCTAVLPYSQALSRFPAHLQQLDMESNGKSVSRIGEPLTYPTGPIVFGEPGTNGQHSFYQLLHQGTDVVPLQFVGFRQCQRGEDTETEGSTSQAKLNANLAAQIIAFAKGKPSSDANRNFEGMRPSTLLVGDRLNARSLGALLAHFETKVMFQGFCWNINSFDQEGVQLGKQLARSVLDGGTDDEALRAYADILGL